MALKSQGFSLSPHTLRYLQATQCPLLWLGGNPTVVRYSLPLLLQPPLLSLPLILTFLPSLVSRTLTISFKINILDQHRSAA